MDSDRRAVSLDIRAAQGSGRRTQSELLMAWGRKTCMRSHMCAAMASSSWDPGSCPSVA